MDMTRHRDFMLLAATDYAATKFKLCYFVLCFQMVFLFNFELNYVKSQRSVYCNNNKPRTAKVRAISKAENCKRGPFWLCRTPFVCKKSKQTKGDPSVQSKKFQKNCLGAAISAVI